MARVLVVEDDALIADDIERTLVKLGYEVAGTAASGREAIRLVAELRPNLILMDIKLQGAMDGIQAASAIRSEFGVPVVYLTSHSDEATLHRAKVTQPHGYLLKPFSDRELRTGIEVALHNYDLESKLAAQSEILSAVLKNMGDGVLVVDIAGNPIVVNPAAEAVLGRSIGDDLRPDQWPGHFGLFLTDKVTPYPARELPIMRAIQGEASDDVEMFVQRTGAGDGRWSSMTARPLRDRDGTLRGGICVIRDVTERRRAEDAAQQQAEELRVLSVEDELTGLFNRRGFLTMASHHWKLASRGKRPFVLLFMDMDGLKTINDQRGHEFGDNALVQFATILRESFRSCDIVARLGGDEFVVLASDCPLSDAGIIISRLRARMASLNASAPDDYDMSVSIGVAVFEPTSQETLEGLLKRADSLMYEDKRARREARLRPGRTAS